jgi:nucleoside-diphosphate-sugar epimerase
MSRVLVTGASGFVGRAAVAALRARDYEVHGSARTPRAEVEVDEWHAADLLDPAAAAALADEVRATHLLHLAWTTAHGGLWSDPANLAWSRSTCALVEAFAGAGGSRAVLCGTCAQYAWDATADPASQLSEATSPRGPASLYGVAKQATEELLEAWSAAVGMSFAAALVFFPYGPHEAPQRLVSSVARSLMSGQDAQVTAGTQVRDFIHVADCGAALAALVESEVSGAVNVGTGVGVSVAEVATCVARIIGREDGLRLGALPSADGGTRVVADVGRLRDEVGFVPRHDLDSGLRDAVDWWRTECGYPSAPHGAWPAPPER